MSPRDIACGVISLGCVRALESEGLCVVEADELERLRLDVAALRERIALLEAASLDLAGVALDNRAPGDKSTRGLRP